MDELLQRVLQAIGKTESEFNQEVEEIKSQSLANQNQESLADAVTFLIVNADAMAQANAVLIQQNADLQKRVEQLEGNTNV